MVSGFSEDGRACDVGEGRDVVRLARIEEAKLRYLVANGSVDGVIPLPGCLANYI